jgi:uncharacterized protein
MTKWIVVALLVLAVWYGYRWLGRAQRIRSARERAKGVGPAPTPGAPRAAAEDMRKCPACGVYVSAGSGACGRPDCPQRPAA